MLAYIMSIHEERDLSDPWLTHVRTLVGHDLADVRFGHLRTLMRCWDIHGLS